MLLTDITNATVLPFKNILSIMNSCKGKLFLGVSLKITCFYAYEAVVFLPPLKSMADYRVGCNISHLGPNIRKGIPLFECP